MSELLIQPTLESNAQIFRGVVTMPVENVLPQAEQQFIAEVPNEPVLPHVARHRSAESVSLVERWRTSTVRRKIGVLATATAALLAGGMAFNASPAAADSGQDYTITDAAAGGYFSRNSPHTNDTPRIAGKGVYPGDRVRLICGVTDGDPVGPYNNKTWHKILNLSRPDQGEFWENDHLFDTPNKANELAPGEKNCNSAEQAPEQPRSTVKGCYYNIKAPSKDLTFYYEGDHRYYGNAWQAAKNWSDAGAGLNIHPGNSNDAYIRIKDVDTSADWVAKADIPEVPEFVGPHKTTSFQPRILKSITILVNIRQMEKLKNGPNDRAGDFKRTYTLTHEMGHTLGLAHPDQYCGYSETSVMDQGTPDTFKRAFNTPMPFDKAELKQFYN